eukprot:gnl/TRDRNA2_/TRDRNA2_186411_c0_seq1.p1 gnl/TRDRNA2_/TRDRNA2_186411_c0~~gnl/TRDRNA2_/TRDRNA2_186411_c0_seq1.p1  ORF type:complete len:143 (-),score=36.33 gnl/TRDRNA2_/TRDRNA2_186411_c0_seq1:59-487(-)
MRNNAPGQWREWRWEQLVVPLYIPDPKVKLPEDHKPFSEITYTTIRAIGSHQELPKLREAIGELLQTPDSPGGRISEDRFRKMLQDTATAVLPQDELEAIFPPPPPEEEERRPSKGGSRKPSKSMVRRGSKDKLGVEAPAEG